MLLQHTELTSMAWQWEKTTCFKFERLEFGALMLQQTNHTNDEEGEKEVQTFKVLFSIINSYKTQTT